MITVDCKDTGIHPNFFVALMEAGIRLDRAQARRAEILYLLAGALPTVEAGILYDLAQGKLTYSIDLELETFTIWETIDGSDGAEGPPEPEEPPMID